MNLLINNFCIDKDPMSPGSGEVCKIRDNKIAQILSPGLKQYTTRSFCSLVKFNTGEFYTLLKIPGSIRYHFNSRTTTLNGGIVKLRFDPLSFAPLYTDGTILLGFSKLLWFCSLSDVNILPLTAL